LKTASKTIWSLSLTAILAASLAGCGPQGGLNRDFASADALLAALSSEGFECDIFEERPSGDFQKESELFGMKSMSWCYPTPNTGEIGIFVFQNASGADEAAEGTNFTCNGTATDSRFIKSNNCCQFRDTL
jgi:predicted small lipoprotein YifL